MTDQALAEEAGVNPTRLLVDFRRVTYVSSTGFAVLFKLVSRARAEGREVKLCGMENGVRAIVHHQGASEP